ncbi:MAG: hypothetical protein KGL35_21785 [Bradyrhizobium sp.]|nr:hypothetical protein [Pseudomonadota bacterium]MDE2066008.1 hypothetical protein [Bradyrhizobium sp.]MDE2471289.1 hypothetical protein [Bradyrhizobium sp.]
MAVPACVVEPLKLVALAVAGDGHWYTGVAMVIAAYVVSLFVVERLFVIVKPKLLQIRRFARLWAFVIGCRNRFMKRLCKA